MSKEAYLLSPARKCAGSFLVSPRESVGKHLAYLGSSRCGLHCPSLWLLKARDPETLQTMRITFIIKECASVVHSKPAWVSGKGKCSLPYLA